MIGEIVAVGIIVRWRFRQRGIAPVPKRIEYTDFAQLWQCIRRVGQKRVEAIRLRVLVLQQIRHPAHGDIDGLYRARSMFDQRMCEVSTVGFALRQYGLAGIERLPDDKPEHARAHRQHEQRDDHTWRGESARRTAGQCRGYGHSILR